MYDLIIIGGGPAGLTAAVYAIRKRLNLLLLSKDLGGKTNFRLSLPWVEEYQVIKGLEIVSKFRTELEYLDYARHIEPVEKVERMAGNFKVHTRGGAALESRAVLLATGTRQVRMDVPGEKDYTMRGLCYSALSYAPLFIDRTVMVVGDGGLALRAVGELATLSREVTLICTDDNQLDTPIGRKIRSAHNVRIIQGCVVVEVKGDEYARKLILKDRNGNLSEHAADGFFVEMGLRPNNAMVNGLVEMDKSGRVIVDSACRTNVPGFFAAGDVTNSYAEQVLVAVGEGAKAALSAYEYLLPLM